MVSHHAIPLGFSEYYIPECILSVIRHMFFQYPEFPAFIFFEFISEPISCSTSQLYYLYPHT